MRKSVFGRRSLSLALAATAWLGVACSNGTGPDVKPTRAEITVTGSSPVPLRLVVSTDFVETFNTETGVRSQVLNSADTSFITTLPFTRLVQLTDVASILVDLANPDTAVASIRLQVELDSGQSPYDQAANMSQGGSLRYVFSYFSPTF